MTSYATSQSLEALGERLSRVPRRLAGVAGLLAVLAVGGGGVALAAAHPALGPAAAPTRWEAPRPSLMRRPGPWDRHEHRPFTRREEPAPRPRFGAR